MDNERACKNCIYANQYSSTFRECRRYPPPYHQTNEDWWCGEFKPIQTGYTINMSVSMADNHQ